MPWNPSLHFFYNTFSWCCIFVDGEIIVVNLSHHLCLKTSAIWSHHRIANTKFAIIERIWFQPQKLNTTNSFEEWLKITPHRVPFQINGCFNRWRITAIIFNGNFSSYIMALWLIAYWATMSDLWLIFKCVCYKIPCVCICMCIQGFNQRSSPPNGVTWWRHQMETFSALLALCAGNSPVPVNSPHKGQWRGALMFSLICAWINDLVNNREAGDLRRHRGHYDVMVMTLSFANKLKLTQYLYIYLLYLLRLMLRSKTVTMAIETTFRSEMR